MGRYFTQQTPESLTKADELLHRDVALDPLSITTNIDAGEVALYARRYDEASMNSSTRLNAIDRFLRKGASDSVRSFRSAYLLAQLLQM